MADKLNNIINKDTENYPFLHRYCNKWLKSFDTQLNEPTNQILIKVPKVVEPTNKK